jgi:fibronectin-binding autotransporter adhesin
MNTFAPTSWSRRAVALATIASALAGSLGYSAEISKLNNTEPLTDGAAWQGGIAPGAGDIAVFDKQVAGEWLSANLAAPWAVGGIRISDTSPMPALGGRIQIDTGGNDSNVINLGFGGLDMSTATQELVLYSNINLTSGQTWTIGPNLFVDLWLPLAATAGSSVDFRIGANSVIALWTTSTPNTSLRGGYTINSSDFAGIGSNYDVSPLSTALPALYLPNPSDAGDAEAIVVQTGAPTNSIIDVTNSNLNAAATAFSINAYQFYNNGGIRFNQPHAVEGTPWTIQANGEGRFYPDEGPFRILISPNVGARDVIISGPANPHVIRFNGKAAAEAFIYQGNTAGDFIFRGGISAAGSLGTNHFTKAGPGRMILANTGYAPQGTVFINEGTLQLGEGNATGTFESRPIRNNGILRINRSDVVTMGNAISGVGALQSAMTASGHLILTGNSSYTGKTTLASGTLTLGSATALGATTSIELQGGTLRYGAGVGGDITAVPVVVSGDVVIDTNGNNVAYANGISGAGGLIKSGAGRLTLNAASTYVGDTTVLIGSLRVANASGSATGSGSVLVSSGAELTGAGSIAGAVSVQANGNLAPGAPGVTGTLTVSGLTLAAGSGLQVELTSLSSHDKVVVSNPGGLTINGGVLSLYAAGTSQGWTTVGTYNLIQYSGAIQGAGVGSLTVANAQPGYGYTFGTSNGWVTVEIFEQGIVTQWTATGSGSFGTGSNWSVGVPTGDGATANFTTTLASAATVTLDGNRTLAGLAFNSQPHGYTLAQGSSGALTLSNGTFDAGINVIGGVHVISAPVTLGSGLTANAAEGASLTFSGVVSGTGNLLKTGPGSLTFSGANSIVGSTAVQEGVLVFGQASSIGDGAISLNGGALRFGAGNTTDISNRVVTFGPNGATIDTNGNDLTFANAVGNSGVGGFTKAGAGTLTFTQLAGYSGTTSITGGTLAVSADNQIGGTTSGLTINGGTLRTSTTFSIPRVVTVGANGGGLNVAADTTLTVAQGLLGSGLLTKSGNGILILNAASTKTGGTNLAAGSIYVGNGTALGGGNLAMANGTLFRMQSGADIFVGATIDVAPGATVTMTSSRASNGYSGLVNGDANASFVIGGTTQVSLNGAVEQFANFPGTVTINAGSSLRFSSTNTGGKGGQGTTFIVLGNLQARNNGTVHVGELRGSGEIIGASGANGNTTVFSIGARNADSVFTGIVRDADLANTRRAALTKVGTGALTLSGVSTYTGATNVNGGTLNLTGSLGESTVTVAAAGTLAGRGTIGGAATVNGTLRPGASGLNLGQLTFAGNLTLGAAGTTQFDFGGQVFVGVKTNAALTLNGALKLNFLGTVYNGSYQLFQAAEAPTGAFTGVTVSAGGLVDQPLTDGGTVWTGTVNGVSYSYAPETGVLTVTGGANAPAIPAAPTVTATAGNTQVTLNWNAPAGAARFIVKRSLTAGGPYTTLSNTVVTANYVDTGLTNGTPYFYVVAAANDAGISADSAEVTATPELVVTLTPRETWRQANFGTTENTGNAADNADPDGDGFTNIVEFALGTNPNVPNAGPVPSLSGGFLRLTYTRSVAASADVPVTAQAADSLTGAWSSTGVVDVLVGESNGIETREARVPADGARSFLRLSIQTQP